LLPLVRGRFLLWLPLYLASAWVAGSARVWHVGATYLLLACTVLSAAYTLPWLARRVLRGQDISYGMYIYHMLVVNLLVVRGWQGHGWAVAVVLASSAVLASLSWRLVERPALRLKRARRQPVGADVAPGGSGPQPQTGSLLAP
jgi:peptidoglycan/LPS O-acetylase OafA/YrhL